MVEPLAGGSGGVGEFAKQRGMDTVPARSENRAKQRGMDTVPARSETCAKQRGMDTVPAGSATCAKQCGMDFQSVPLVGLPRPTFPRFVIPLPVPFSHAQANVRAGFASLLDDE